VSRQNPSMLKKSPTTATLQNSVCNSLVVNIGELCHMRIPMRELSAIGVVLKHITWLVLNAKSSATGRKASQRQWMNGKLGLGQSQLDVCDAIGVVPVLLAADLDPEVLRAFSLLDIGEKNPGLPPTHRCTWRSQKRCVRGQKTCSTRTDEKSFSPCFCSNSTKMSQVNINSRRGTN
jgi:hypothetical protein